MHSYQFISYVFLSIQSNIVFVFVFHILLLMYVLGLCY